MGFDSTTGFSVHASDLDTIASTMQQVFGDVDVHRDRTERPLLRMAFRGVDGLQIVRWSMSGACGGLLDRRELDRSSLLLGLRLAGTVELSTPSGEVDTAVPYLCPEAVDSRTSASDIINLAVDRELIAAQGRALTGDEGFDVRFTSTAPIDPAAGDAWRNTVAYATRALVDLERHPHNELLRATVLDLVSAVTLQTFPNTALDAAAYGSARRSAAVRRVMAFIDEHLTEPIRIPDLAAAAGMSVRGLHAAFQRDVGRTPMAQVRALRMAAVRRQLLEADPAEADLRGIVTEWGFSNPVRFSKQYACEFGETPQQTLLR